MSVFKTVCAACGGEVEAEEEWVGMEAECPHCEAVFVISAPAVPVNRTGMAGGEALQPSVEVTASPPHAAVAEAPGTGLRIQALGGVEMNRDTGRRSEPGADAPPASPKPLSRDDLHLKGRARDVDVENAQWYVMNAAAKKKRKGLFGKKEVIPAGPFGYDQMCQMVRDGELEQYHMVCRADDPENWVSASDVRGLFGGVNLRARLESEREAEAAAAQNAGMFAPERNMMAKGMLGGMVMMGIAVVWFAGGLMVGILFYYPPILFLIGLFAFLKGVFTGNIAGR